MLIRSQDKDCVVSMEKISELCINKMSHCIPSRCTIDAEYASESIVLGIYESIERAKEVLGEIIYYNAIMKSVELGFSVMNDEEKEKYDDMIFGCYDMPAE